jgi:hypothetical protein
MAGDDLAAKKAADEKKAAEAKAADIEAAKALTTRLNKQVKESKINQKTADRFAGITNNPQRRAIANAVKDENFAQFVKDINEEIATLVRASKSEENRDARWHTMSVLKKGVAYSPVIVPGVIVVSQSLPITVMSMVEMFKQAAALAACDPSGTGMAATTGVVIAIGLVIAAYKLYSHLKQMYKSRGCDSDTVRHKNNEAADKAFNEVGAKYGVSSPKSNPDPDPDPTAPRSPVPAAA